MKDTSIIQRATEQEGKSIKLTELRNDGKKYFENSEVDTVLNILGCHFHKGVVLAGRKGVGKTAVVKQLVQRDLEKELNCTHICVLAAKDEKNPLCIDDDTLKEYRGKSVIMYARAYSVDVAIKLMKFAEEEMDGIKEKFDLQLLKLVIETATETSSDASKLTANCGQSFYIVQVNYPEEIADLVQILKPHADEFAEIYGVKYEYTTLEFCVCIIDGECVGKNINFFLLKLEQLFSFARRNKRTELDKSLIKLAYKEEFDYLLNEADKGIAVTAYHESGHVLCAMLSEGVKRLQYVTIVPCESYRGCTYVKSNTQLSSVYKNKDFYINQLVFALAGLTAEKLCPFYNGRNSGASGDLYKAMQIVDDIVLKYGMSETLGENYVVGNEKYISNSLKEKLEEEKRKILHQAGVRTQTIVTEHSEFIKMLAKRLLQDYIIVGNEVEEMWKKYSEKLD